MRAIIESMEEQSLLDWRERIDIRNGMIVFQQKVKRALIQMRQRKIRWSKAACPGSKTMADDL